ncbi:hypothetical protein GCM10028773_50800 [Spirosoma koreense]
MFPVGTSPYAVAVSDVNDDGKAGIIAGNTTDSNALSALLDQQVVAYSNCFGQTTFPVGSVPTSIAVADINNDGKPDVITANRGTNNVSVSLGLGTSSFGAAANFPTGSGPTSVAVADVNGDGWLDIMTANAPFSSTVSVLLGTGTGSFGVVTSFPVGAAAYSMTVADVNKDGNLDIITANTAFGSVSVLLGTGTGSFGAPALYPTGSQAPVNAGSRSVPVADVNGDGNVDIIVANAYSGRLFVLLGTGTGSFGVATAFPLAAASFLVAIADVNEDGKPDLITSRSVLLGTGTGSFGQATPLDPGDLNIIPWSLTVNDVNRDGKVDLVFSSNNGEGVTAYVSILLGDGTGSFGTATNFPVGLGPTSVAVADVNGDDRLDIMTANQGSNNVSVLLQGPVIGITSQPVAASTVAVGATVTASVSVSGTAPFSYQWYHNSLANAVAGQTSATLTLSNVQLSQAGNYSVVITDCNSVTSTAFNLVVTQPIRYVKADGSGDGSSWALASGDLQAMINAEGVQQVWVAGGTYKPTTTTDRSISFSMKNGVAIYGGFAPTGDPGLAQRNPDSFTTILSGDIDADGTLANNSIQVVNNPTGLTSTAELDGFVITGGNSNVSGNISALGGGMRINGTSSPTLRNCVFQGNYALGGAGIFINGGSPMLVNCLFVANVGGIQGGGVFINGGSPVLTNCTFQGNSASFGTFGSGGGIIMGGSAVLTNCTFQGNSAGYGGAVSLQGGSPTLVNCSFVNNFATNGGAMSTNLGCRPNLINCSFQGNSATTRGGVIENASSSTTTFTNCVLFGNGANTIVNVSSATLTASYSLFEPGVTDYTSGPGNLTTTTSPFASTATTQLAINSPAINAGNSLSYTAAGGPPTDLGGNVRIQNGTIDMGAYELGLNTDLTPVVYARTVQVDGATTLSLVVDVFEINIAPTTAPLTVRITKDAKVALSFDNSLSSVGGRSVQNSAWSFDATQPGYYQLSTSQPMTGGDVRSVGLRGVLSPTGTDGMISLSATVAGGGEDNLANNTDADKIEYFQQ